MIRFESQGEEETIEIAKKIAKHLKKSMTILLQGDLGAGKTTLTKGLGEGLGISRIIKSPSYTIVREYEDASLPLYHVDLYRLEEEEVIDLALDEYFDGDGVTVVEWPSVSREDLPKEVLEITLERDLNDLNKRSIQLKAIGEDYEKLLDKLKKDIDENRH